MGKAEENGKHETKQRLTPEEYKRLKNAEKRKRQKEKKKDEKVAPESVVQKYLEEVPEADIEVEAEEQNTEQTKLIDPEAFLTGKDYDNFRNVFEGFNNHVQRLEIKTYENIDVEKERLREQKEQEAEQKRLQQQQAQQLMIQNPQLYYYQQRMGILPSQKQQKLSKKQRKQLRWLKVAELKQLVKRPDLVEFWDITSTDPLFLVHLKSQRNTVSIPRHWSQKRKYLQNKRGVLKEYFKLPEYIENTGIARLRDPFVERDGGKMVRQKLRERMNPKLGKLDIDYQVLHDAFFKHQTKPPLTKHGDIYFEGKEEEMRARTFKPGRMSAELRAACGLTDFSAPPWLPNMQRYGPPPSYPYMKFIGMNQVFSEASTYHTSVKQIIEDTAKKMDQAGLYATFKYMDDDDINEISALADLREEHNFDKSLWGVVNEAEEDEMPAEE